MSIVSKLFYKGLILAGNEMQKSFNVYTQHPLKTNEDLLFNIIYENKDTLYGKNHNTAFYLHVLFALKEEKLMYIGGLFISAILDFFRFIENNQEALVNDLRTGKINNNIILEPKVRKILNNKLGKCPKRAAFLEEEFNKGFNGIARRIWPKLIYIASVTGANFVNYNELVNKYTDNLPICSIAYAATEGFIGVNPY